MSYHLDNFIWPNAKEKIEGADSIFSFLYSLLNYILFYKEKEVCKMWKITYLRLKNFAHIYSGLDKTDISLNFEDENIINIFIGKMGSGKSAILGHLQPYASYGTLDVRNSDKQILEEKDGLKEITFTRGEDTFTIQHKYTWNKNSKSHNIKSYIQLNGNELNPNGNSGSFKDLIKVHFGIEQSYLRLLRLGPNVTNLVDLKSTDRKNYVASLLTDADVYTMLYKKLSEVLRNMNAKISVLSNKLMSLSADKIEDMRVRLSEINTEISNVSESITQYNANIISLATQNELILNGNSTSDFLNLITSYEEEVEKLEKGIIELEAYIEESSDISLTELNKEIAKYGYQKQQAVVRIEEITKDLEDLRIEYSKLKDMRAISKSEDHLNLLKENLQDLQEKYDIYENRLNGFSCRLSYRGLAQFIDDLNLIKRNIDDISSYSKEDIALASKSDSSLSSFVTKKVDILIGRKINLQKSLNNMRYSESYNPQVNMFRPPFCPTKSCPYYQTHPCTIQNTSKDDLQIRAVLNKIEKIDVEIAKYQEIPILAKKIQSLKSSWIEASSILKELGVLKESNLYNILTNLKARMSWYKESDLIDILELCKMREDFYELSENLSRTKMEIKEIESSIDNNINEKIENLEQYISDLTNELGEVANTKISIENELERLEGLYTNALNIEAHKKSVEQMSITLESRKKEIEKIKQDINTIHENNERIENCKYQLSSLNIQFDNLNTERESLSATIHDVEYTQSEFEESTVDREYLKDIISATSSKEGIPLILVKLFLDNCRDIVNDLISDVFQEGLEILDFNITDTEFKIPYMTNGMIIDDIESASQGQKAVISIALSFALVRQLQMGSYILDPYNIMLLDEMDGPLYKKDRDKFIQILFKQLHAINAKQVFLITHNHNSFEGNPVNIIMTTEEVLDKSKNQNIYRLY